MLVIFEPGRGMAGPSARTAGRGSAGAGFGVGAKGPHAALAAGSRLGRSQR